jgi:hypothetical protein
MASLDKLMGGRPATPPRPSAGMSQRSVRVVGAALVALMLLAGGLAGHLWLRQNEVEQRERDRIACQERYNEANNARTRALTEVTAAEREAERRRSDALDAVFLDPSLLKPADQRTAADRERILRLFKEYLAAIRALLAERADADRARAANPVPPPPSAVCG